MKDLKKNQFPNKIRIIGGKWKGFKIPVLNNNSLRPTTNYMRETLFNWLAPYINQSECLDCFAGSGSLGLEALSRNALSVTFLEKNFLIFEQLKKISHKLNIQNQYIFHTDTLKWLQNNKKNYNLVFLDPPFTQRNLLMASIQLLQLNNFLHREALIYVENNSKNNTMLIPASWILYREKTINYNNYRLYKYNS